MTIYRSQYGISASTRWYRPYEIVSIVRLVADIPRFNRTPCRRHPPPRQQRLCVSGTPSPGLASRIICRSRRTTVQSVQEAGNRSRYKQECSYRQRRRRSELSALAPEVKSWVHTFVPQFQALGLIMYGVNEPGTQFECELDAHQR
jgi:hypothetical protein